MHPAPEILLDRSAFRGPVLDVDAFPGSFVGQATFNGYVVFCLWPRSRVARLLPGDLVLAANVSPAPELHPVVFVFGDQTRGATLYGGLPFDFGVRYQEFAFAVPFVHERGGRYLHTHLVAMVSSNWPATWSGNVYYGFPKQMGAMGWQGPLYLVMDAGGRLMLHAQVEPTGDWRAGGALPEVTRVRGVFSLPVLGRSSSGLPVSSYFDWGFSSARVRPVAAGVTIDLPFAEGLEIGSHAGATGSLEVEGMTWRLSWPGPARL